MSDVSDVSALVDDGAATAPVLGPGVGRVIVLLSLTAFGSAMSMRVMDAALPRLAGDFAITIRQAANVVTVFAVAYGCLQIVFGPSGDRFGKLKVIGFACISGALASVACGLASDFTLLLFARTWAGASMASIMPLSMAWIGDHVAYENRQPVLARFLVGQISGIAAGQAVGGIATDLLSWRAPFAFLAIWFVAMAVLLRRVARQPRHRHVAGRSSSLSLFAQCLAVLRRPWARRVLIVVFIEGAALYGPFAFFATHFHVKHGLSLGLSGTLLVAFAIGGVSFAFGAGRLVGRLGERGLAQGGALLMFAGIAVTALGPADHPAAWFALPGLFAMGLGFYMLHNTLQINATQMAPDSRGTAVALFASAFFLGQSTGVALAGVAVERLGTTPVMLFGACVLLLVGSAFAMLHRRRER